MKSIIYVFVVIWAIGLVSCKSEPKTTSGDTAMTTTQSDITKSQDVKTSTPEATTLDVQEATAKEEPATVTGNFELSGSLADGKVSDVIQLVQIPYNNTPPKNLASSQIGEGGQYRFDLNNPGKGVYGLRLNKNQLIFLLDGTEKNLQLSLPANGFKNMAVNVKGSELNKRYYSLMKGLVAGTMKGDALTKALKSEPNALLASLVALQALKGPKNVGVHQLVLAKLNKDPQIDKAMYIAPYAKMVADTKKSAGGQQGQSAIAVGSMAPDLAYKNPDGNIMKLSDLRGKLVLLDFWASWCGPCRRANPEVVRIYKKYESKGFTVFSVSLDGDRRGSTDPKVIKMHHDKWTNAIAKDGLIWPNHVSDLKNWSSDASAKYGVRSIPATFLIGRDGRIVAVNPRHDLEEQVKKFL